MKLKKEFSESSQKQVSFGEERKEGRKEDSSSRTPDRSDDKGRIGVDHRSKDIKKDKKKKKKRGKDK